MGLWQIDLRHSLELRAKPAKKVPLRVLINHLFGRRVDAEGIDPCDPGLHLKLAVMNSRFVIEKVPR